MSGAAATCDHCGKPINGQGVMHVPPNYLIQLGIDAVKQFHSRCYLTFRDARKAAEGRA